MASYRINVNLPQEIEEKIKKLAKQRCTKPSRLLRNFIIEEIERVEREVFKKKMIEGAKYMAEENRSLSEEFSSIDLEGWKD